MSFKMPSPGMRLIKTGVSIFICLTLAQIIKWPVPIYACIAAVLSMKGTVAESFKYGISRMVSTIVGGLLVLLVLLCGIYAINPYLDILLVIVGAILTLYFCVIIKAPDAAGLSCVIFLIIVLQHPADYFHFTFVRVMETIVGIAISVIVNKYVNFDALKIKRLLRIKQKSPPKDSDDHIASFEE